MPDDDDAPPSIEEAPPVPPMKRPEEAPTGFWPDFAARLKAEVPNKCKGFLPGTVQPQIEQNLITLVAESKFVKNILDIPEVLEPAARIASAMLGRPMRARCIERTKNVGMAGGKDLLNDLVAFGQKHDSIISIKE